MSTDFEAYERLGDYPVDERLREQLYAEQLECTVAWTNRDGWPVGVMHWFVWHEGRFWVTVVRYRKRVAALRARPQSCVVVSSAGTRLGTSRTVTAKTLATIHELDEVGSWFVPALGAKAWGHDPAERANFEAMLLATDRIVVELAPVAYITYDAVKMYRAVIAGRSAQQATGGHQAAG